MAPKAKLVGATALADETTETSSDVLVEGAATATAETPVVDVVAVAEVIWPKQAVLRNHSGTAVVEPITGKYLQAGGSEPIELRDQEHEDAVAANVVALSENAGRIGALALDFV
jgi:hypothetical protein